MWRQQQTIFNVCKPLTRIDRGWQHTKGYANIDDEVHTHHGLITFLSLIDCPLIKRRKRPFPQNLGYFFLKKRLDVKQPIRSVFYSVDVYSYYEHINQTQKTKHGQWTQKSETHIQKKKKNYIIVFNPKLKTNQWILFLFFLFHFFGGFADFFFLVRILSLFNFWLYRIYIMTMYILYNIGSLFSLATWCQLKVRWI